MSASESGDGSGLAAFQHGAAAAARGLQSLNELDLAQEELAQTTSRVAGSIANLLPERELKIQLNSATYTFRRVNVGRFLYANINWLSNQYWALTRDQSLLCGDTLKPRGREPLENGKNFFLGEITIPKASVRAMLSASEVLKWATPDERLAFTRELPELCEELARLVSDQAGHLRKLGATVKTPGEA